MSEIKAIIFDWAGTVVDYGCFAPMDAFMQAFEQAGVPIAAEEARGPMGLLKRDHIQAILDMERVKLVWGDRFGRTPSEADADGLYAAFERMLMASLHRFSDPIPGVLNVIEGLRRKGLKIGSTTGYTRPMMEVVRAGAKAAGYEPDYLMTPDEAKRGRPYPYMIYQNLIELEIYPPRAAVKVGDTLSDVREARNAGVWSVAVVMGSSELGLSAAEAERMPEQELQTRVRQVRERFAEAGADYVIDTMAELPAVIEELERRLGKEGCTLEANLWTAGYERWKRSTGMRIACFF